jgi:transposase
MIEPDKRKAVYLLHQEGMSYREISRRLSVGRNTVHRIIAQKGEMPVIHREKKHIDEQLLRDLYHRCNGYCQRVCEILVEEYGIEIAYSTLTLKLRELGISSKKNKTRCDRVPDQPGQEMQHDSTLYKIKLADKSVRVVASILYLRYCKRRYLKFYRSFNRFNMKCFLHEALMFWGYSAGHCVIDNTNLARLSGSGSNAVIVPEMEQFAKSYGFKFICHAIGHPDRKAGNERSFWTTETNFLPGRKFNSLEDLNRQALAWAVRMENRPQGKGGLIPAVAFEYERDYLIRLPSHLPAPYQSVMRCTDKYGYVAYAANFYYVPGSSRDQIKVLVYSDKLKLYRSSEFLIEYPLPADTVKNRRFSPKGQPQPRYRPNNQKKPAQQEEKHLRSMSESVSAYLDFVLKSKGIQRHQFLRKLHALSRKTTKSLFIRSIERAHKYKITNFAVIERIAALHITEGTPMLPFADIDIDEDFRQRDTYQQGKLTDLPELEKYDDDIEENDNE